MLRILLRFGSRYFVSLLVIIATLVAWLFLRQEIVEYMTAANAQSSLERGEGDLKPYLKKIAQDAEERARKFESASLAVLNDRIKELDREIQQGQADRENLPDLKMCMITVGRACDGYIEGVKLDGKIRILEQERDHLRLLQQTANIAIATQIGYQELERLKRIHVVAYATLNRNEYQIALLKQKTPFWKLKSPWSTEESQALVALEHDQVILRDRNQRAFEAWNRQKRILDALTTGKRIPPFKVQSEKIDAVLAPLTEQIARLDEAKRNSWVAKFSGPVLDVLPTALGILLAAILTPVAIKAFCYFAIAPLAASRPAMVLVPRVADSGEAPIQTANEAPERLKISAVSPTINIDPAHELLIHPEYIQSSAVGGTKDTKWLLDWSYPLSSLAAGMFGLTRIRATDSESVVLSASLDPLCEVGIISLQEGSAIVLQPHCLIGIVQSTTHPLRISRKWRLGTLHAWLTLQLRFLVFHGPAKLIVKGSRGVRLERAGNGRSINQAATIGFSANLAYATTRCETFGSYLMGKQELFNDKFSGSGYYVYEETPHFGKKGGIAGRGLQGIMDTVLKVFGV